MSSVANDTVVREINTDTFLYIGKGAFYILITLLLCAFLAILVINIIALVTTDDLSTCIDFQQDAELIITSSKINIAFACLGIVVLIVAIFFQTFIHEKKLTSLSKKNNEIKSTLSRSAYAEPNLFNLDETSYIPGEEISIRRPYPYTSTSTPYRTTRTPYPTTTLGKRPILKRVNSE